MKNWCSTALVVGASVFLVACGGGGDGATSTNATAESAPLSASNYDGIGVAATLNIVSSAALYEDVAALSAGSATSASSSANSSLGSGRTTAMVGLALSRLMSVPSSKLKPAAVSADSANCAYGGTLTETVNDADNSETESAGDTFTLQADNCVQALGAAAINGQVVMTIDSLAVDGGGNITGFSSRLAFNGFSSDGVVLNGSVSVAKNATAMTLTYNGLTTTYQGQVLTYGFTVTQALDVVPNTVTAAGTVGVNGGTYGVSTPGSIRLGEAFPEGGTVRIVDSQGNRVDVWIYTNGLATNLYLAGAGMAVASSWHPWTEF